MTILEKRIARFAIEEIRREVARLRKAVEGDSYERTLVWDSVLKLETALRRYDACQSEEKEEEKEKSFIII